LSGLWPRSGQVFAVGVGFCGRGRAFTIGAGLRSRGWLSWSRANSRSREAKPEGFQFPWNIKADEELVV
jgi:hypothetical protein